MNIDQIQKLYYRALFPKQAILIKTFTPAGFVKSMVERVDISVVVIDHHGCYQSVHPMIEFFLSIEFYKWVCSSVISDSTLTRGHMVHRAGTEYGTECTNSNYVNDGNHAKSINCCERSQHRPLKYCNSNFRKKK